MIPFQVDPYRPRFAPWTATATRRARPRRVALDKWWWLPVLLFIAVAAVEAVIVVEAGIPPVEAGDYYIAP